MSTVCYKEEAIEDFILIFNKYIKQFFPSNVNLEIKVIQNNKVVKKHIINYKNKILFYPCLENPQIYGVIYLNYAIASTDIIRTVLKEIMKVSQYTYNNNLFSPRRLYTSKSNYSKFYYESIYNAAFQIGICNYIAKDKQNSNVITTTLLNLLSKMETWSSKTYEGNKVPFGFIIDSEAKNDKTYNYIDFLDNHSSAVFTDGIYGGILLDKNGNFIKYFSYEDESENIVMQDEVKSFSPYNFLMFTEHCTASKIGVLCLTTGDLLLIKNKKLLFSRRNGNWIYYDYNRFRYIASQYIEANVYEKKDKLTNFIDQIYLTILDVSFSHTGGCLAITYHDKFDEYKKAIENDLLDLDLLDSEKDTNETKLQKAKIRQRKRVIKNLLESTPFSNQYKDFYDISRKLRQELLGLDGATIVNSKGKLLAAGAIVSIDGGSEHGGRTAATRQLAKYGFSIKISEDGYIQCYGYNKKTKTVENILNFC